MTHSRDNGDINFVLCGTSLSSGFHFDGHINGADVIVD
ncbi:hypothetical protein KSF78_0009734 [Schistosoma japonicum]|nr:hypothetical protein KSF78_0009734 [Schistosoma japonicum]